MSMERGGGEEKSSEKHAVPRGYVPVLVGSEKEMERFLLRVELFKHPSIMVLLEVAAQDSWRGRRCLREATCRCSERVLVHTNLFKHPCFVVLLEMAAEELGYDQRGILRIPCSVELFLSVINAVEKAKS
ncbi:Auxin-responsive protein SAUR71 [Ananas comosus]|uniref:Auxin-responsive protein SAUR71 n=1 Tax=Ananas comosus TaxID=4615 RepID=A0A199V3N1_ANACO|nr:Auxin-responsive protein SAUR71 [Ananas comosus]